MKSIRLGRTGVEVPVVSVGTWGHSGPRRVRRHPVGWTGQDDAAARAALLAAWDAGLTHWDTADAYGAGHAERLIGGLWREVPRSQVFLASKVGWEKGQAAHGYEPDQMRRQIDNSLLNLDTEVIDLFYLHHCDFGPGDCYLDSAIEVLHDYRRQGKIRWIGLSDWDSAKVATYAPTVDPDVVQVYRSVLHDQWEASGLAAWADGADAGACFFSPLQHGLLLGTYDSPPEFARGDHRSRRPEFRDASLLAHLQRCRQEVALRFPDSAEPVLDALVAAAVAEAAAGCVLLGMRRPAHAEAAARITPELSPADLEWVRRLYRRAS